MIHPRTLESLEYPVIISAIANLCNSPQARKLAMGLKPYKEQKEAETALQLYNESCLWRGEDETNIISSFPDLSGLLAEYKRHNAVKPLDIDAFWALRETLRLGQSIHTSMEGQGNEKWPNLLAKARTYPFPMQILAALNRCLSDDGLLKDESSPELFQIRSDLRKLHQSCLKKVREYAQQYNMLAYLQDEFMTLSSDRYVLPLKANFKGRMQGIIHDWSQTGETCYFEPYFLVEINNRLQELKHQEREEERKILHYLTDLFGNEIAGVENLFQFLSELDLLQAIYSLAVKINAFPPRFCVNNEGIELLGVRHPLLTLSRITNNSSTPVRPIDIILRSGERALIITGGNAGGKTVCLKSLGLLAVMAMTGLPIPASENSRLPWFDRIDAFIGDEQSITANASTFSAQIEHLAKALPHLDDKGLALLDEFGAGTDPAEGAALAQATHDELLQKQCYVVSATHFPALKSYALSQPGVRAATMLFDPATSKPLYKLAYDQVGSSQALTVAAEYGLPDSIIKRAQHYLLQDGEDSRAIIQRLNDLAATREEEISKLRKEQEKGAMQLAEQQGKLSRERMRLHTEIQSHIRELMHAWKTEKGSAKQALKAMSGLREELGLPEIEKDSSILPQPEKFLPGQLVKHIGLNKNGIITDIDERRNRIRIDLDGVSIWTPIKDLRQTGEAAKNANAIHLPANINRSPVMSMDIRGQRAAEAITEVEKFMDNAIMGGASEIEIIHGRGTGALRREIHSFLRSLPSVSSFQLAPEDRGGDGMTIVKLK